MEKFFKLKEHGTSVPQEFAAGLTTFMTMAYILAVNPGILSSSGMDAGAVFTATALASAIASFLMGFLANLPFVLSAGMGLNAYFAYTVCLNMGYPWQMALTAVFMEGLIFIVLSLTNVREAIFNAIPESLKIAVSVGIGLFITFIGLQNAHIVVGSSTLVSLFSIKGSLANGTFHSEGITVILALIGIMLTAFLMLRKVKGSILLGIIGTWVMGIIFELAGIYVPDPNIGFYSVIPTAIVSAPAPLTPTLFKIDISSIFSVNFLVIMFAFLFVDMFDTLGTLIGCAAKADLLDEEGHLPGIRGALFSDAVGTMIGALMGTSTVTTFVESASGIAEGGRTGLTAIAAGLLFLVSLFFSPLFLTIPSFATAPALVMVGYLMMQSVGKIKWDNLLDSIPAFICMSSMGFMYSISEGISFGIISYTFLHVFSGKAKDVTPLMYVLTVVFILKYFII